ncbi:hypothetical protein HDU86_000373 [Geranomyces michiganensis]|nr:hypothetical protein HDU86_000373 [Geranomyces michiganensis]
MDENSCCICLGPLGLPPDTPQDDPSTSSVAGLKGCGHFFHTACIQQLYSIRNESGRRCPLCRYKFKISHSENPLFYLPEKPFQLYQNWLEGSLPPASASAGHVPPQRRHPEPASVECTELRASVKEFAATIKKQEKKIAKLQQEKATVVENILQQEAEMQALQSRHRDALKEKDKALRTALTDAAIEHDRIMAAAQIEIATLNSYRETLERTIQTNAFIAEARQPNECDSWSASFPEIVGTLETAEELKDLLISLHRYEMYRSGLTAKGSQLPIAETNDYGNRKYQKCRSDVKHWRVVAGEQKLHKERALHEVKLRGEETAKLERDLGCATERGNALKEQLCAAKAMLEAAQAESNNFRVRHGVICEDLAMARSKLAQAERRVRELAQNGDKLSVPAPSAGFWDPVVPPIANIPAKITMSTSTSSRANPFGALATTAKTPASRTGTKKAKPAGMMARFLAPQN